MGSGAGTGAVATGARRAQGITLPRIGKSAMRLCRTRQQMKRPALRCAREAGRRGAMFRAEHECVAYLILLQVIRDELGHLEHRHLALAAEDGAELFVRVDQAPVDGILKFVLLDVVPDLLGDFGARQR